MSATQSMHQLAPSLSATVMCSCLDWGLVHALVAALCAAGYRVISHSDVIIPDVEHQRTQSSFKRRDIVVLLERRQEP